jgi:hypothetical protein
MSTISMKDFLRDNEMDGIANMCQIRAIGFAKYLSWYDQEIGEWDKEIENYATDYMFDGNVYGQTPVQKTVEEMYKEYLKYLEDVK